MELLLVAIGLFLLLVWVMVLIPEKRRLRAHQQVVAALEVGDEVVLTAGIYGRITSLGPEDVHVEVAPGVELRVARQAVLRRMESDLPDSPLDDD